MNVAEFSEFESLKKELQIAYITLQRLTAQKHKLKMIATMFILDCDRNGFNPHSNAEAIYNEAKQVFSEL